MPRERHISSTVLPSLCPASTWRSSLTICSGLYVLVFTVSSFLALSGRLGLSYHVDQLSGSRPGGQALCRERRPSHRRFFPFAFGTGQSRICRHGHRRTSPSPPAL